VQPSYEQVCTGTTGHNEVVKLVFDPLQISVREIFEIFFLIHDPSTLNRQGHDTGTQYRSGIYFSQPQHDVAARDVMAEMQRDPACIRPIVTELLPLANYWPAEDYHQNYFAKNSTQAYCLAVAAPKVAKFRKTWARLARN
jgi:peptide-methionine (S)-S-oxide reductase